MSSNSRADPTRAPMAAGKPKPIVPRPPEDSDDTPEAIAKRLETYEKETAPLLDIYEPERRASCSVSIFPT